MLNTDQIERIIQMRNRGLRGNAYSKEESGKLRSRFRESEYKIINKKGQFNKKYKAHFAELPLKETATNED